MTDPRPISDYENRHHAGLPKAHEPFYSKHIQEIEELRKRDAAYYASLPKDRETAMKAVFKALRGCTDLDERLDQVLANLTAIEAIAKDILMDNYEDANAIYMIASRSWIQVKETIDLIARADDILKHMEEESSESGTTQTAQVSAPPDGS